MLPAPLPPPEENVPGPFGFADPRKTEAVLQTAGWRDISITPWDGPLHIGDDAQDATAYILKIGPTARAIAEHSLDPEAARQLIVTRLQETEGPNGVWLPAACWIVSATA